MPNPTGQEKRRPVTMMIFASTGFAVVTDEYGSMQFVGDGWKKLIGQR
jgi:hypothetical protein